MSNTNVTTAPSPAIVSEVMSALGKKGGSKTTPAKAKAARLNGKRHKRNQK